MSRAVSKDIDGLMKCNTKMIFTYLLWRDVRVAFRTWRMFLATTFMQPILLLLVFGLLLPSVGQVKSSYAISFLPGLIGLTIFLAAMQAVSIPLAVEFGYTKEIEDRLLAPVNIQWIAVEKLLFGAFRGLVAGVVLLACGQLILRHALISGTTPLWLLLAVAALDALEGAALGLFIGSSADPAQVGLVLSSTVTPLVFASCVYYSWTMLAHLPWLRAMTCASPLTYANEGLRMALASQFPHMPLLYVLSGQFVFLAALVYFGMRGFLRRAIG